MKAILGTNVLFSEPLVTGNLDHFPAARRRGMRVLSPAGFLRFYGRQMRS